MINIAQPIIAEEEIAAVNDVLASGMLAQGPKVAEFEANFAAYCGTKYAVAVNSGTAALHAALYAAGVRQEDEVITTPFSFIATINPILMLSAKPVLVDISTETFNIDSTLLEAAISKKTKAIIPVHLYGQPANMDEINAIAVKHGLLVIEDACQAIGATYGDKKAGNLGDLGCFSLYATKNIMCGEGGVVTTNNENHALAIKKFRQHGMTATYDYDELGYNYRMTDLQAAIAVEQLRKVDNFNTRRQQNAEALSEGLENVNGIELPRTGEGRSHVFHQYTVRVNDDFPRSRDDFVKVLRENGVGAGVYYPKPLHAYPHIAKLGYALGDFPEAEKAASQVVSLPVHPSLTDGDIKTIIQTVIDACHV